MSDNEKEAAIDCLFSRQGMVLDNVKFFRGESDAISEEAFKAELKSCAARKANGTLVSSNEPPKLKNAPVDVRDFVANI